MDPKELIDEVLLQKDIKQFEMYRWQKGHRINRHNWDDRWKCQHSQPGDSMLVANIVEANSLTKTLRSLGMTGSCRIQNDGRYRVWRVS